MVLKLMNFLVEKHVDKIAAVFSNFQIFSNFVSFSELSNYSIFSFLVIYAQQGAKVIVSKNNVFKNIDNLTEFFVPLCFLNSWIS